MCELIILLLTLFTYPNTVSKHYLLEDLEEFKIVMKDVPAYRVNSTVEYLKNTKDFKDLIPDSAPYVHTILIKVNNDTVYIKEGGLCINLY